MNRDTMATEMAHLPAKSVNCAYCGEPVLAGETFARLVNAQDVHRECMIRMVIGSAAHQLGECPCQGGTREDPPQMTKRQAAQLAYDAYLTTMGKGQ